jgi:hypothetical protein
LTEQIAKLEGIVEEHAANENYDEAELIQE